MRRSPPARSLASAVCLLVLAGCGGSRSRAPEPGGQPLPALVPAEDLGKRLQEGPRPLVLDARSKAAYEGGHVPGARPAPVDDLKPYPSHTLDDAFRRKVERMVRVVGARPDIETVVVGAGSAEGFEGGAMVCWALSLAGVERCRVLEGGIAAWSSAGGELEQGPYEPPKADPEAPPPPRIAGRPTSFADLEAVRAATASGEVALVDATGATPAVIPGSAALPVRQFVGGAGGFDAGKVEPFAAAAGLRAEGEAIVLGEGPLDGAVGWFVTARVLKVPVTRLYPGGLAAWKAIPAPPATLLEPAP